MKFLKNNLFTLLALGLVFTMSMVGDASAQAVGGNTVMDIATNKALNVFKAVKTIIFVVGGFGLVGLAFQAIFGKVKWAWFAGLAVGLAVLAAAGAIVDYATGQKKVVQGSGGFDDTFKQSTGNNF